MRPRLWSSFLRISSSWFRVIIFFTFACEVDLALTMVIGVIAAFPPLALAADELPADPLPDRFFAPVLDMPACQPVKEGCGRN